MSELPKAQKRAISLYEIKTLINQFDKSEITMSRFTEIVNEKAESYANIRAVEPVNNTCPCHYLPEACSPSCSCVHPYMSGGCSNCAGYGSIEQRKSMALAITGRAVEALKEAAEVATVYPIKRDILNLINKYK